jgi:septation ring formation regulator EzrA
VISALVSTVALGSISSVLADNTTPVPSTPVSRQTERLPDVQARADHRINQRVDALNHMITRLQNDSRMSANDRTLLQNEDQAAITGLTSLKAKIDADTTVADVRNDEKQIATYHVYDFLAPHNRHLIAVNNLQATAAKVGTSLTSIQTQLTTLQGQGTDVSAMQTLLNDANSKLQTINGQLTTDQQHLAALTPSSSNPSATFSQVRKDLGTIRSEFSDIRKDLVQIKADVQALKKPAA